VAGKVGTFSSREGKKRGADHHKGKTHHHGGGDSSLKNEKQAKKGAMRKLKLIASCVCTSGRGQKRKTGTFYRIYKMEGKTPLWEGKSVPHVGKGLLEKGGEENGLHHLYLGGTFYPFEKKG